MTVTEERVVQFVTLSAGVERSDIAAGLGLPGPTVTGVVRKLLASGALVEDATSPPPQGRGRPPRRLHAPGPPPAVGLLGWQGDAVLARCLDLDGHELARRTVEVGFPVETAADLDDAVAAVTGPAATAGRVLRALLVAVPAPLLRSGGPVPMPGDGPAPGPGAPSFPVRRPGDLAAALTARHGVSTHVDNDANLRALAERRRDRGGRGGDDFVYLTLTEEGFGCALVAGGRLLRGVHGFAGELAHLQMDFEGPLCACGGRGCLRVQVARLVSDAAQAAYDRPITLADLPRLAEAGDAGAARMLHDIGVTLGRPLAHLCTFLDPDRVVVDDALGPAVEHVTRGVRDAFAVGAPPAVADRVEIVTSVLGGDAERWGAIEFVRHLARGG